MDVFGAVSVLLLAGPVLLLVLVVRREREVYGRLAALPETEVMRTPCADCGAALAAAELLYVARAGCSARHAGGRLGTRGRELSGARAGEARGPGSDYCAPPADCSR